MRIATGAAITAVTGTNSIRSTRVITAADIPPDLTACGRRFGGRTRNEMHMTPAIGSDRTIVEAADTAAGAKPPAAGTTPTMQLISSSATTTDLTVARRGMMLRSPAIHHRSVVAEAARSALGRPRGADALTTDRKSTRL